MTAAILGLGGNIGDTRDLMARAIERLAAHPGIAVGPVSALYRTPPWGKTDQPPFLNAAILVDTSLAPRGLLDAILDVERQLGRERGERWGPCTIDIDILLYGEETIDEPGLHVPHPRLAERAFALAPLVDLTPDAEVGGRRAADVLKEIDTVGLTRLAGPGWRQAGAPGGV